MKLKMHQIDNWWFLIFSCVRKYGGHVFRMHRPGSTRIIRAIESSILSSLSTVQAAPSLFSCFLILLLNLANKSRELIVKGWQCGDKLDYQVESSPYWLPESSTNGEPYLIGVMIFILIWALSIGRVSFSFPMVSRACCLLLLLGFTATWHSWTRKNWRL